MSGRDDFIEAQRRVAAARESGAKVLDLGDLDIERLPVELEKATSLHVIALGKYRPVVKNETLTWEYKHERTSKRQLRDLTPLAALHGLTLLDFRECTSMNDLTPLAELKHLQSLDLRQCTSVVTLKPLAELKNLQSLALGGCTSMSDLTPLAELKNLRSLRLVECTGVVELKPLAELKNLQSLYIRRCAGVSRLKPLAELKNLRSLHLRECTGVAELKPLAGLQSLISLSLWLCESVSSLTPLAELRKLQSLDLGFCTNVSTLTPLAELKHLQLLCLCQCTSIVKLTPLAELKKLQSLDLRDCTGVVDLTPLTELKNLQSLSLRDCTGVSDLTPLAELKNLQSLDLGFCTSVKQFAPLVALRDQLQDLFLQGCQFKDLDVALCGRLSENVIEKIRAHYRDQALGRASDNEVRVILLGNGGVGKTQVCRRLRGKAFKPQQSTQGLEVHGTTITLGRKQVGLNLWDFAGQDIYHNTHALFCKGRAVFIVMWTPQHESGTYEEAGIQMRRRPLVYWLDYIRSVADKDAPIIIARGQCDDGQSEEPVKVPTGDFKWIHPVNCSSIRDYGIDDLKGLLKRAVRQVLRNRPALPIGEGRVIIRDQLRALANHADAKKRRERLTVEEFGEMCKQSRKIDEKSVDAFLDWLHQSGVVFYDPDLFDGQIIIDQNWALRAIYAVFNRVDVLPRLQKVKKSRRLGELRFSREKLAETVWKTFAVADQKLFLRMMVSCRICFPICDLSDDGDTTEWEYIAPELLPDWDAAKSQGKGTFREARPVDQRDRMELAFDFLHEGILKEFLYRVGRKAAEAADYWKYGCWFREETTQSQFLMHCESEIETGRGTVVMEALGEQPTDLLRAMLEEIQGISHREHPEPVWPNHKCDPQVSERVVVKYVSEITDQKAARAGNNTGLKRLKIAIDLVGRFVEAANERFDGTPQGLERLVESISGDDDTSDLDELSASGAVPRIAATTVGGFVSESWLNDHQEQIATWFDTVDMDQHGKCLRTFWWLGREDFFGIRQKARATGYRQCEREFIKWDFKPDISFKERSMPAEIRKAEELFSKAPFLDDLSGETEDNALSMRRFRYHEGGKDGKETWWTPRATQAWFALDYFFGESIPHDRPARVRRNSDRRKPRRTKNSETPRSEEG